MCSPSKFARAALATAALAIGAPGAAWAGDGAVAPVSPQVKPAVGTVATANWSWLADNGGTYWFVPSANLQALQWDTSSPSAYTSVTDQTVWHIDRYENGYFSGPVVAKIGGRPRICQYMIGSVTPSGKVYISFNAVETIPVGSPSITTGTGAMITQSGDWTFNMQMASGSSSTQITHWAFMRQCVAGQTCWNKLPGIAQSVPSLLSECGFS